MAKAKTKKKATKKISKTTKNKKTNVKTKASKSKVSNTKKVVKNPSQASSKSKEKAVSNKKIDNTSKEVLKPVNEAPKKVNKGTSKFKNEHISNAQKISRNKKNDFQKNIKKYFRKIKMYGLTSVIPLRYLITSGVILLIIIIAIIGLSIEFNKVNTINLTLIPDKIDQITTVSFDIDDSNDIVTSSNAFSGLKDYYEYDFDKVFSLDKSYVDDYVIKYNKTNKEVFIVIKPSTDNGENVKKVFDSFLKTNGINDYLYKEYQGYQIYIKSSSTDNDAIVLSKIMQSNIRVFSILQELKADDIESTFGIKESYYEEALVKTSMLRSDTCQYLIFKPKNPNTRSKIINLMSDYYAGLESKWQGKDEDNYNLVCNREFKEVDGYLIYIVSYDNDLVMDLIKG